VLMFGAAYAVERFIIETWKTFFRLEDQSKYTIPMQLAVLGRPVRSVVVRWVLGALYFAGGFGVQANYTYSNAEADNGDPIPGNSENSYNLAGYFENERVSARLAYTYRSEFFVTFDRSTQLNQDDLKSLDASVSVNITDHLALTFDGVNLTNEEIVQFATDSFRPRAVYDNGRIYFAGARFKF